MLFVYKRYTINCWASQLGIDSSINEVIHMIRFISYRGDECFVCFLLSIQILNTFCTLCTVSDSLRLYSIFINKECSVRNKTIISWNRIRVPLQTKIRDHIWVTTIILYPDRENKYFLSVNDAYLNKQKVKAHISSLDKLKQHIRRMHKSQSIQFEEMVKAE